MKTRKTLEVLRTIEERPSVLDIIEGLNERKGWKYKTRTKYYRLRDQSMISLTYLGGLRISETLRLTKDQFIQKKDHITIAQVRLSKRKKHTYRIVRLPLTGEREELTQYVIDHLKNVEDNEKVYCFKRKRAWQIFVAWFPEYTCHWFRAFGEEYLYGKWNNDILAVAQYIGVDSTILAKYITQAWKKYKPV